MAIDVTDATFDQEVMQRSHDVPVVVDLWAPWCGPCRTLGPIIEKVIDATEGKVVLAKVNVDENPAISQAFRVQSIPAVYAVKDGQLVDGFVGAQGEAAVLEFVSRLLPTDAENRLAALVEAGDEASLREALELQPDHHDAIVALSELLVRSGDTDGALALLERIPEDNETRRIAAMARSGQSFGDDIEAKLDGLLARVKNDDDARQEYVDLLEMMGPNDPRTSTYRRKLTSALF
jgi:putative thioredoxin